MSTPSPRGATLAKIGALLQFSVILGILASVASMNRILGAARTDGPEQDAPKELLGAALNQSSGYFFTGLGLALLGLILVIIAAVVYRYRSTWFFTFLCVYGTAATFSPFLPLGLFMVIYAVKKRKEFPREPGALL